MHTISPSSQPQLPTRNTWMLLIALTLLAGLTHFLSAYVRPSWLDECYTWLTVRDGVAGVIGNLRRDVHPPIYFWMVACICQLIGDDIMSLRLLSLLVVTACIPMSFMVFRLLVPIRTAWLATFWIAFSPTLNHYASEARGYGLLAMLSLLVFIALERFLIDRSIGNWCALAVALVLIAGAHHIGSLALAGVAGAGFINVSGRGPYFRLATGIAVSSSALLSGLIWLPAVLQSLGNPQRVEWMQNLYPGISSWFMPILSIDAHGVAGFYPRYLDNLAGSGIGRPWSLIWNLGLPIAGLVTVFGLLTVQEATIDRNANSATESTDLCPSFNPRTPINTRRFARFLICQCTPTIAAWILTAFGKPILMIGRNDLPIVFVIALLHVIALDQLLSRQKLRWLGGTLFLVSLTLMGVAIGRTIVFPRGSSYTENARRAINAIKPQLADNDVVIGIAMTSIIGYYDWRRDPMTSLRSFPAAYDAQVFIGSKDDSQIFPKDLSQAARQLVDQLLTLPTGTRVWIVLGKDSKSEKALSEQLEPHFDLAVERSEPGSYFCLVRKSALQQ